QRFELSSSNSALGGTRVDGGLGWADDPSKMGEPASKRLVGCDQLRPCSLCPRHVDHVVNRVVIVSASQLPCEIQFSWIVSDANGEAREQPVGAVSSRTAPTPPANAGDES